jgi:hypothetical protein
MHALKKAGLTIVTGTLVGAFATVAIADQHSTLLNVGDYGTFESAAPNGWADQVWATGTDSLENTVLLQYLGFNGITIQDTSGQLVTVSVDTAGSGYGQNNNFTTGTTFQNTGGVFLADGITAAPTGWWNFANTNDTGSGGFGSASAYKIDGPAGALYYQPGFAGQNDFMITNGSTGYMPGPNNGNTMFTSILDPKQPTNTNALTFTVEQGWGGQSIGSFGFLTDNFFQTGHSGVRNVYVGSNQLSAEAWSGQRNASLVIINDNATIKNGGDDYGNFRLYLGATPPAANGNSLSFAASAAGQVANLALTVNGSENANASADAVGTSGIGYTAGDFMVYDDDGMLVDVTIAYEVDLSGRVYTNAKGMYRNSGDNFGTNASTGGPTDAVIASGLNATNGWSITSNTNSATDTSGWTVVPQGNGTGFECTAVHLYGQVVGLQSMCTNGSFDTVGIPEVSVSAAGSAVNPGNWSYTMAAPHAGSIVAAGVTTGGSNYLVAPVITPDPTDTGTLGTMTGTLGGVGQRTVNVNGTALTLDLVTPEYQLFTNSDFNGDGNSDLLWESQEYGTFIWNMGPNAEILSSGQLPITGGEWDLIGCGQFDYEGVGSCLFWYNDATGQTSVWVINSSSDDASNWLVGGHDLTTLTDPNWLARCTNNATQNSGSNAYWHNADTGQFAVWPINVNANGSSASLDADGAGFVKEGGGSLQDILLPASDGWSLVGVANMAGRPSADGNIQRDMILQSSRGETAIWLMDSTNLNIDVTAATGTTPGAGVTSYLGADTVQEDSFVGVGIYNFPTTYSLNAGLPSFTRLQQFASMNWTFEFQAATWKMDRNVSLIDYTDPRSGTGLLTQPWTINFPVFWN